MENVAALGNRRASLGGQDRGSVVTIVGDDQELILGIQLLLDRANGVADQELFVVGGDQHGDSRPGRRRRRGGLAAPEQGRDAFQEQRGGGNDQHRGPDDQENVNGRDHE